MSWGQEVVDVDDEEQGGGGGDHLGVVVFDGGAQVEFAAVAGVDVGADEVDGNGGGVVGLTAARGPEPVGADDGATGIFGSAAFAAGVPVGASGSPLLFSAADGFGGGAADRLGGFGGTIAPVRSAPALRWTRESLAMSAGGTFSPAVGSYEGISGFLNVYVQPTGNHGTELPDSRKTWDEGIYYANLIAHYFQTSGGSLLYHEDPIGHRCLEDSSPFVAQLPRLREVLTT